MTIAERLVRLCARWLPPRLSGWGEAMAGEAASIEQPGPALAFALGCVFWAMKAAGTEAIRRALSPAASISPGGTRMTMQDRWPGRGVALACAIAATGLGLVYLTSAGAPPRMMTMNIAALVAGLVLVLPFKGREPIERPFVGAVALVIGFALLMTAAFGEGASGARRWISVAGVVMQPSLMLLPLLIVGFARSRDAMTTTGIILAAVALAWQPDRAMAGALVAGVAMVAIVRRDRPGLVVLGIAAAAFAITCLRADVVPATPFVDRVFRTAFSTGLPAGLAVWGGAAVLVLPALLGVARDRPNAVIYAAFGATWAAIILAAIAGDYPTPLVAYGGSSIIGYLLATVALPRHRAEARDLRPEQAHQASKDGTTASRLATLNA